jgi:hypothetical protein
MKRLRCGAAVAILVATTSGSAAYATASDHGPSIFTTGALLPGDRARGSLTIAASPVAVSGQLRARDVSQSCANPHCVADASQLVRLTVRSPNGDRWSGNLSDLERGINLPGGTIPERQARRYSLSMTLPSTTGNAAENQQFSALLTWTVQDASGRQVGSGGSAPIGSGVEGEHEQRTRGGRENQTTSVAAPDADLPFTGFDAVLALTAAAVLLGAGLTLLAASRMQQRRRP